MTERAGFGKLKGIFEELDTGMTLSNLKYYDPRTLESLATHYEGLNSLASSAINLDAPISDALHLKGVLRFRGKGELNPDIDLFDEALIKIASKARTQVEPDFVGALIRASLKSSVKRPDFLKGASAHSLGKKKYDEWAAGYIDDLVTSTNYFMANGSWRIGSASTQEAQKLSFFLGFLYYVGKNSYQAPIGFLPWFTTNGRFSDVTEFETALNEAELEIFKKLYSPALPGSLSYSRVRNKELSDNVYSDFATTVNAARAL